MTPSPWVVRCAPLIGGGGAVLDLAAGNGRHGRWLRQRGHPVTFVDIDVAALDDLREDPGSTVLGCDLERDGEDPLGRAIAAGSFAAVVVVNYLWRPLWPALLAALAPGGVLIYETFAAGQEALGRPRRPEFLLRPGELLEVCAGLHVVAFEQGVDGGDRPAVRQRICAVLQVVGEGAPLLPPAIPPVPPTV